MAPRGSWLTGDHDKFAGLTHTTEIEARCRTFDVWLRANIGLSHGCPVLCSKVDVAWRHHGCKGASRPCRSKPVRGQSHQRKNSRPATVPAVTTAAMRRLYQRVRNGSPASVQWNEYTQAPSAPAISPTDSPASAGFVGAIRRMKTMAAINNGIERAMT